MRCQILSLLLLLMALSANAGEGLAIIEQVNELQARPAPENSSDVQIEKRMRESAMAVEPAGLTPDSSAALLPATSSSNRSTLYQNGSLNYALTLQSGYNNQLTLEQTGHHNQAALVQRGDHNSMSAMQGGDSWLQWEQQGSGLPDLGVIQHGGGLRVFQYSTGASP